jgi:hypothetical protein
VEPTSTPPPPRRDPEPGHGYYLAEQVYLEDPDFPVEDAYRVTAGCAARWADTYQARPLGTPGPVRAGDLALPADRRAALVLAVFDELRKGFPGSRARVDLFRRGRTLLFRNDLSIGYLVLTPEEYVDLRRCWREHGLPDDTYYPATEQPTVTEPVGIAAGGVILMLQRYTPRQWERRDEGWLRGVKIPTEAQRVRAFERARMRFIEALSRRIDELSVVDAQHEQVDTARRDKLLNLLDQIASLEEEQIHTGE